MTARSVSEKWPAPVRLYGVLFSALLGDVGEHRHDATETFHDLYHEARGNGALAGLRYWLWSTGRLLSCAAIRRDDGAPATEPAPESATSGAAAGGSGRSVAAGGGSFGASPPSSGRSGVGHVIGNVVQDLRYAARTFAKSPAFAITAILILAVGIGATTTIFSVVDGVVLRSLPYPEPDRLVAFTEGAHRFHDFIDWQERLDSFGTIAAAWTEPVDLTGEGAPEQLRGARITEGFMPLFGSTPYLGRYLAGDDFVGEPTVAVLGYGIWNQRFGADPSVVGRTLRVDGDPMLIVGISGPEFEPPEQLVGNRVDVWLPLDVHNPVLLDRGRGFHVIGVAGRLEDEATLEAAQTELDAFLQSRAEEFPDFYTDGDGNLREIPLMPLRQATVRQVSATLYMLLGAVGLMLLIACANVANLFLARGTARGREVALRGALGASRRRIVGQLLTESVMVAVAGGLFGVGLAYLGVNLFANYDPGSVPRLQQVVVDVRVLLFVLFVSVGTGVTFGILPALQAARADVNEVLKEGAGTATSGRRGRRTRSTLVVAEIALALVLLVGAGLLFRSLMAMVQVDPGFETDNMVTVSLTLGPTYTALERTTFADQFVERLGTMPGTQAAAAGWSMPFVWHGRSRCCWRGSLLPEGATEANDAVSTWMHPVTADYFATLAAPIAFGRAFQASDGEAEPAVIIINKESALELFDTENAVGKVVMMGEDPLRVIGVAEGVHHYGLSQDIDPSGYVLYERFGGELPLLHAAVRSTASTETVVAGVREAVWALEPDLPIEEIRTMEQRVSGSMAGPRFLSLLFGSFAMVALLLAAGGIYGSMLYSVGQRRREMGIRLALGAAGSDVVGLVLQHGILLTVAGLALGVGGALGMSRLLESLIWGITTTDTVTFVGVTLVLAVAALAACFVPAWKASRTDPLETLRAE